LLLEAPISKVPLYFQPLYRRQTCSIISTQATTQQYKTSHVRQRMGNSALVSVNEQLKRIIKILTEQNLKMAIALDEQGEKMSAQVDAHNASRKIKQAISEEVFRIQRSATLADQLVSTYRWDAEFERINESKRAGRRDLTKAELQLNSTNQPFNQFSRCFVSMKESIKQIKILTDGKESIVNDELMPIPNHINQIKLYIEQIYPKDDYTTLLLTTRYNNRYSIYTKEQATYIHNAVQCLPGIIQDINAIIPALNS